jgi:hypothetical protein
MNRTLKNFIVWPLVVTFLLLVALRLALGPIAKSSINNWFEQQGIDSSIEDISFEVSDGRLTLTNLTANDNGSQVLALEQASLAWSWSALLDSQVKLNSIEIAGLAFDVERGPGERLVIAGIDLEKEVAENEPAPATADSEPLAWSIALQQLSLQNFKLCYRALPKHDLCNRFETLSWDGDISLDLASLSEPALPLKVAGDFRLVNLKTHDNRACLDHSPQIDSARAARTGEDVAPGYRGGQTAGPRGTNRQPLEQSTGNRGMVGGIYGR